MQNTLQDVWSKYSHISRLFEGKPHVRAKNSEHIFNLIDQLKQMGFVHSIFEKLNTRDVKDILSKHIDFLNECGLNAYLFLKALSDLEIIENENDLAGVCKKFIPFWVEACNSLFSKALFTFDDQKYWAYCELEKQLKRGILWTGATRYHHVLVDEFQDVNPLDLNLIKLITQINKASLVIAGDDDQAIYEFRGASPNFIIETGKYIDEAFETFILRNNYRSPKNIVDCSQKLIANNNNRIPKDVVSTKSSNAEISILHHKDIIETIQYTKVLTQKLLQDTSIQKIALISRKRSQILPYQVIFAGLDIPFFTEDDLHLFLSNAFNELKGLVEIRARFTGSVRIEDILSLCNKIKGYPLSKSDSALLSKHLYSKKIETIDDIFDALKSYRGKLKGPNKNGHMSEVFATAIREFLNAKSVANTLEVLGNCFDGLKKNYGKSIEDIYYSDPPFFYLVDLAQQYGNDYNRFFNDIEKAMALASYNDSNDNDISSETSRRLHLTTALRAKGKEYDAVIILDANDGIWPHKLAESGAQQEAERRLFYVAVTRARKKLYFVFSDKICDNSISITPYIAEMGITTYAQNLT